MSEATVPGVDARDLTPEEVEERARLAHSLERQVLDGVRAGRQALWAVAGALHAFDAAHGWSALDYETLSEWLAQPGLGMSRRTYYRSVQMWQEYVVLRGLDPERMAAIDISKADIVLPALKRGDVSLEEALDDAEALGQRDLRDKYLGEREESEPEPEPESAIDGTPDEPEDIEGEAHDVEPEPESNGRAALSRSQRIAFQTAYEAAEEALAIPQRSPGYRRASREALVSYHELVRAHLLSAR